jgi:uncharacterized protein YlxW (UPF0749 family)
MSQSLYLLGQNQQGTSADVTVLQGEVATLQGQMTALQGQVAILSTRVTSLQAQVTALQAQIDGAHVLGIAGTANPGGGGVAPATVQGYLNLVLGITSFRVPLYLP